MEYLPGRPLSDVCGVPMPAEAATAVMMPVLRGLAAAHDQGVLHRDLKPENIFLCEAADGTPREPKLLDFGISKVSPQGDEEHDLTLTKTGAVMGTPLYMSPEQLRGKRALDPRVDVYAMGVVLYELLTGEVPFHAETFSALVVEIVTGEAPPPSRLVPDLPAGLEDVVLRAMARDPDDRYPSAEALAVALEPFAGGVRFDASDPRMSLPIGGAAPAAAPADEHRLSISTAETLAALVGHGGAPSTGRAARVASVSADDRPAGSRQEAETLAATPAGRAERAAGGATGAAAPSTGPLAAPREVVAEAALPRSRAPLWAAGVGLVLLAVGAAAWAGSRDPEPEATSASPPAGEASTGPADDTRESASEGGEERARADEEASADGSEMVGDERVERGSGRDPSDTRGANGARPPGGSEQGVAAHGSAGGSGRAGSARGGSGRGTSGGGSDRGPSERGAASESRGRSASNDEGEADAEDEAPTPGRTGPVSPEDFL